MLDRTFMFLPRSVYKSTTTRSSPSVLDKIWAESNSLFLRQSIPFGDDRGSVERTHYFLMRSKSPLLLLIFFCN
jgi:hypothetical protein